MYKEEISNIKTTEDAIVYLNKLFEKDGEVQGFTIERDRYNDGYRVTLIPMCSIVDYGVGPSPKEAIIDVINKYHGRIVYY